LRRIILYLKYECLRLDRFMSGKISSGKSKGYSPTSSSSRSMTPINKSPTNKFCSQYGALVFIIIIASYFLVNHLIPSKIITDLEKDRSETYKVRIIPASLNDEELNNLPKDTFSYLAMIDAGSSGCRAHVYRYGKLGSSDGPLYILPQHVSKKVKPGLSSFSHSPSEAGSSLAGLVDFIKTQVPEKDWELTPIWLKATAGLRMLEESQSTAVLASVSDFLSNKDKSPFLFRPSWAKIISGNEEGGFGWIAFNYLKKIIGPKKLLNGEEPYAVVEMGGASAQVSQMAPTLKDALQIPPEYKFSFTIEKETYHLYTHSYLGYGAEQARELLNKALLLAFSGSEKVVSDPCLNKGFERVAGTARKEIYEGPTGSNISVSGAASASGDRVCSAEVAKVFSPSKCSNSDSNNNSSHKRHRRMSVDASSDVSSTTTAAAGIFTFNCVFQPSFVSESKNLLVFENFYYTSSALAVQPSTGNSSATVFPLLTTPLHIKAAADKHCGTEWSVTQSTYPLDSQSKDVNLKLCFVGSYSYSFLVDGLRIDKNKVLTIQKEVGNSEIEWALGAAYKEAADFLRRHNLRQTL